MKLIISDHLPQEKIRVGVFFRVNSSSSDIHSKEKGSLEDEFTQFNFYIVLRKTVRWKWRLMEFWKSFESFWEFQEFLGVLGLLRVLKSFWEFLGVSRVSWKANENFSVILSLAYFTG